MQHRTTHPAAFTLIELLLVLVVIAAALAIAAPAMSGWGRGMRLRDAGDQLFSTVKWARAQAIAQGKVYRLNVEPQNGRYWVSVQEGTEFVPVNEAMGRETFVEDGQTLGLSGLSGSNDAQSGSSDHITFYPTGRVQPPAHLTLSDGRGQVDLVCRTPAEGFRMRKPGEVVEQ
jgi:prepilin-type N-terminal cleavage/methylation domain-containing protein